MNQRRKFDTFPALIGMAVCLLSAVPVVASDSATLSLVAEGVDERVVLTVSGPGDLTYEKMFEAGSTPVFELFKQDGNTYRDGSYTWELRAAPVKATQTRDRDERGIAKSARSEALASGYFAIRDGAFVTPDLTEELRSKKADVPTKDQVILDDLIVDGSLCVGFDCINGESFGFDTIRMKENNIRIKAQDTSTTAAFPSNDWQLTFNDSASGGANKFSIDDIDGGRTPFTIEASAPSHSLYVDDGGRVGFGTSTPVADLHVKSGNTPTLRLEQDGSSGFTAQTWDVAGNEANFFIRDATGGSNLPFRILPGAPSNAIYVASDGDVGMGAGTSPSAALHVKRTTGTTQVLIQEASTTTAGRLLLKLENNGPTQLALTNTAGDSWQFNSSSTGFRINANGSATSALTLTTGGDLTVSGNVYSTTCSSSPCAPDYVFDPDYQLMPIAELAAFIEQERHLPNIPSAEELTGPINLSEMQMKLLEKIEELTLYTMAQQEVIDELRARLTAIEAAK